MRSGSYEAAFPVKTYPTPLTDFDQCRLPGIAFDLLAQPRDLRVDGPVERLQRAPARQVHQHFPREHPPRVPRQHDQYVKLAGGEDNFRAVCGQELPAAEIETPAVEMESLTALVGAGGGAGWRRRSTVLKRASTSRK